MPKLIRPTLRGARKPGPANTIAAWRKFRGLSRRDLAKLTKISYVTIWRVEGGKQQYSQAMLEACAAALDCAPIDLLLPTVKPAAALRPVADGGGLSTKARKLIADLADSRDPRARRVAQLLAAANK